LLIGGMLDLQISDNFAYLKNLAFCLISRSAKDIVARLYAWLAYFAMIHLDFSHLDPH
jgi:hypothetical protein